MKPPATARALFLMALACLCLPLAAWGQQQKPWTWKDREGNVRSRADLDEILAQHKLWVESGEKSGTRADLSSADLSGAILTDADLADADLRHAYLSGANMALASLRGARLDGAVLINAKLHRANLDLANLSGAELGYGGLLKFTYVNGRMISLFPGADLSSAYLRGTNLSDARLALAELEDAIFEPKNLPRPEDIALALGLGRLTYSANPGPLTQLRKQFQDAGFREQERQITYALNRHDADPARLRRAAAVAFRKVLRGALKGDASMRLGSLIEGGFKWVAFDLTCQYGLSPGRPLRIVLWLWLFFSVVYAGFMHRRGPSGIYFIGSRTSRGRSNTQGLQIRPRAIRTRKWWKIPFLWLRREWRVFRAAMFFSLMSAFNIGFRDINFGRWLRMLTTREYDLKARGWARTVSGFQSLLSVYMIALWVLTYFGRPFG